MAKAERKSHPFGWILLGVLVGAIATVGVLLIASTLDVHGGYDEGPSEVRTAAGTAAVARPARVAAPSKPAAPPAPIAVVAAPPAQPPPSVDAQMADDAAAAGMTSRAGADQPTN